MIRGACVCAYLYSKHITLSDQLDSRLVCHYLQRCMRTDTQPPHIEESRLGQNSGFDAQTILL